MSFWLTQLAKVQSPVGCLLDYNLKIEYVSSLHPLLFTRSVIKFSFSEHLGDQAECILCVHSSRSCSSNIWIKTTLSFFLQPGFQRFGACWDSSFPGSLCSFSCLFLVSFTDSCSDCVPAQWKSSLAVMLCTLRTQRKPFSQLLQLILKPCLSACMLWVVFLLFQPPGSKGAQVLLRAVFNVRRHQFSQKSCSPLCNFCRLGPYV